METLQLKHCINIFLVSLVLCAISNGIAAQNTIVLNSPYLQNVPPQPGEDTWYFIEKLNAPLWTKHDWKKTTNSGFKYANITKDGVRSSENINQALFFEKIVFGSQHFT